MVATLFADKYEVTTIARLNSVPAKSSQPVDFVEMGDQSGMETEEDLITHASSENVEADFIRDERIDSSRITIVDKDIFSRTSEVEDTISASTMTNNLDTSDDKEDQDIVHQEDVTLQIRGAVQNLLNDDNLSWSMKTWRDKVVSEIKLKVLDDNTKAIIKRIVHEELEGSMQLKQISQAKNDEEHQGVRESGDNENTQLQSEVHEQNFDDSFTQPQVTYIDRDIIP